MYSRMTAAVSLLGFSLLSQITASWPPRKNKGDSGSLVSSGAQVAWLRRFGVRRSVFVLPCPRITLAGKVISAGVSTPSYSERRGD